MAIPFGGAFLLILAQKFMVGPKRSYEEDISPDIAISIYHSTDSIRDIRKQFIMKFSVYDITR